MRNLGYTIFFLFSFLSLSIEAYAQQFKEAENISSFGDEYFAKEQFYKAKGYYEEAIKSDTNYLHAIIQLAHCHRQLFEYQSASIFYQKVVEKDVNQYPIAKYYLPLMVKLSGDQDRAILLFDEFLQYSTSINADIWPEKNDWVEQAFIEKEGAIFALQQNFRPSAQSELTPLPFPVNTEYNDYGVAIFENDSSIVVTSGRMGTTGQVLDNRFGEALTDNLRYSKVKKSWRFVKTKDKFEITNSRWNDGTGVFNKDNNRFYFTRCGADNNDNCHIWMTEKINETWQIPQPLEKINLAGYEAKHPAISSNEDTLYFVSDRPGGLGKQDIWMSAKNEQGFWQEATNLGGVINTAHNEISPFYHNKTGKLFFSSDGHQSIGGLDVFMVDHKKLIGEINIINLGKPVNSFRDDCYFVLGSTVGYVSSNREGGMGKFDLYPFEIKNFSDYVSTDLFFAGRDWVINSKLNVGYFGELNSVREEDVLFYENLSADDKIEFDIILASKLQEMQQSNSALTKEEELFLAQIPDTYKENIRLLQSKKINQLKIDNKGINTFNLAKVSTMPTKPEEYLIISGKLVDVNSKNPLSQKSIKIVNVNGKVIKSTFTNEDGSFEFTDVKGIGPYKIIHQPAKGNLILSNMTVVNMEVLKIDKETLAIKFAPIYFAYDSYDIASHAKPILKEMADYLKRDPKIKIEFLAYTDSTGTEDYNLVLSRKRGETILKYLRDLGVKENALVVRALGENKLDLNLGNVGLESQSSRKVEFSINSGRIPFTPSYKTIVANQNFTAEEIAEKLPLSVEEFCVLNEVEAASVFEAFSPFTIFISMDIDENVFHQINQQNPLQ